MRSHVLRSAALLLALLPSLSALIAQRKAAAAKSTPEYHIYAGNTHSHTAFTWSHGQQWLKGCAGIRVYGRQDGSESQYTWKDGYRKGQGGCYAMYVINGFQYPSSDMKLNPEWQTVQGPPSAHFAAAKINGFDFYVTSDHSQEASFLPLSPTNPQWVAAGKEAAAATGPDFVGIRGFEYSENDGPGGTGHINVLNSEGILNALEPGVDLTAFYKWLAAAKPSGAGPVVASFNHPDAKSYDSFGGRTPETTDIVTMLEVINSNQIIHYEGFLAALDKGWKVSPVAGNDNHGLSGIVSEKSRTFVLAQSRTKAAILDAMKHRRTYASLDNNIQCRYTVNGAMMGSTLARPNEFRFHISLSDPDAAEPKDRITKIDIVKNGGAVVLTYTVPAPAASVEWDPVIQDASSTYFFVRVWNAGGGDAPGANPEKPIAWLAPVWTGR